MNLNRLSAALAIAILAATNTSCQVSRPVRPSGWLRSTPAAEPSAEVIQEASGTNDPVRQRISLIETQALLHESDHNLTEAARLYESILQIDPRHVAALHRLGIVHTQLGNAPKAESCFLNALQLVQDNPQLHNDYGYYCHLQGNSEAAIHHLGRALTLNPGLAEAHTNLGLVYGTLRRCEEAEEEFRLAGCSRDEALNNLAFARLMTSDVEGATEIYKLALNHNPHQPNALRALASLGKAPQRGDSISPPNGSWIESPDGPQVLQQAGYAEIAPGANR